jgi:hypothetical protein
VLILPGVILGGVGLGVWLNDGQGDKRAPGALAGGVLRRDAGDASIALQEAQSAADGGPRHAGALLNHADAQGVISAAVGRDLADNLQEDAGA